VYQPLIGWKSRRKLGWVTQDAQGALKDLLTILGRDLQNRAKVDFNADCAISAPDLAPADFAGPGLVDQNWIVLGELAKSLGEGEELPPSRDTWQRVANRDRITQILRGPVVEYYNSGLIENCRQLSAMRGYYIYPTSGRQI
jgi:hypothetical protein